MLTEPLPSQADVRKLVRKSAEISADFSASQLPRFSDLLANNDGSITAILRFYFDEQKIPRIDGEVTARSFVTCQRCLEAMPITLDSHFELGVVRDEERAKQLPGYLDPFIVGDELVNLADIVEEELMLSLPFVNYHAPEDCSRDQGFTTGEFEQSVEEPADNPFQVLERLKSDN
jgi:uncharacterized protein